MAAYPEGRVHPGQHSGAPPPGDGPPGIERHAAIAASGQISPASVIQPAVAKAEAAFLGEGQRRIAGMIRQALLEKHAFVAVTGVQGVGKTAVLAAVTAAPGLPLRDISITEPDQVTDDVVRQIERVVSQSAGLTPDGERRTALFVDDAHEASAELLRYLTRVAATDRLNPRSPQVILVGRPELWDRLARAEFAPLAERITVRPVVQPMTKADARGLVQFLLDRPRMTSGKVLTLDAEQKLLSLGRGQPARLKALVENVLIVEDLKAQPPVPIEVVRSAAVRVDGVGRAQRWKRFGVWTLAPVAAVAVAGGVALAAHGWQPDRVLAAVLDGVSRASPRRTPTVAGTAPDLVETTSPPTLAADASPTATAREATSTASPPSARDGADVLATGSDPPAWPGPSQVERQEQPSAPAGDRPPSPGPLPTAAETTFAGPPEPAPTAVPHPTPSALPAVATSEAAPSGIPPASVSPGLSSGMIAMLLRRGDEMLALGDVTTARRYYERTVSANSALGARGVARTYDPTVLGQEGTPESRARAIAWYGIAAALGDAESDRLRRNLEEMR